MACETETFIREAAQLGWSRNEVCEVLNISWTSLQAMLEVIGPLEWVPGNKSLSRKRSYEQRRGVFTPTQDAALQIARENRRERARYEILDAEGRQLRGNIKELAKHFGVSASTVRRRMSENGLSIYEALTIPATPRHLRRNGVARQAHP